MLGQWKQAQSSFDHAETLLRNHCTGVTWVRDLEFEICSIFAVLFSGRPDALHIGVRQLERFSLT
jgi:hypothetical protein